MCIYSDEHGWLCKTVSNAWDWTDNALEAFAFKDLGAALGIAEHLGIKEPRVFMPVN